MGRGGVGGWVGWGWGWNAGTEFCSEQAEHRYMATLPANVTFPVLLPATVHAGDVWKSSRHIILLKRGPALSGLGFFKPCVNGTMCVNKPSWHDTEICIMV